MRRAVEHASAAVIPIRHGGRLAGEHPIDRFGDGRGAATYVGPSADYRFGRSAPELALPREGAPMYGPGGTFIGRPHHVR